MPLSVALSDGYFTRIRAFSEGEQHERNISLISLLVFVGQLDLTELRAKSTTHIPGAQNPCETTRMFAVTLAEIAWRIFYALFAAADAPSLSPPPQQHLCLRRRRVDEILERSIALRKMKSRLASSVRLERKQIRARIVITRKVFTVR